MGKTKFDTCFFERYARCSLVALLGERYASLVNEDRPDLQAPDRSLGIEVTRAMEENKSVADSLLLEMAGAEVQEEDREECDRILSSGYAYGLQGGRYIGASEYDYWFLAQPLKRIIASKVRKVGSGFYGDFREYGLYIFCKDYLNMDDIRLTMEYTRELQKGQTVAYRYLYLSQIENLSVCDLSSGSQCDYAISRGMCRDFFISSL